MVFDNGGQGSLQLIWAQGGRPDGAIAFFSPSGSIAPKDRVSRQLVNGVKGVRQVRNFFRGVAEFISAAYQCGGRLAFFEGIEEEVNSPNPANLSATILVLALAAPAPPFAPCPLPPAPACL